jgi:hypothetical protein
VEHVTVRRWVDVPAVELWERLADFEGLAAEVAGLELVEPFDEPGALVEGDSAVLAHRTGHRLTRLRLEVVTTQPPHHLAGSVSTRASHWLLSLDLMPVDDEVTDVRLRASPEPAATGRILPAAPQPPQRRVVEGVEALL